MSLPVQVNESSLTEQLAWCHDPYVYPEKRGRVNLTLLAIDVVKTRIQIDPALKGNSLLTAGRKIVAAEGPGGLLTGFGPTAAGYL